MLLTSNKLGNKESHRSKEMQELVDAFKDFKIGFAVKNNATKRKKFFKTLSPREPSAMDVTGP